MRYDALRKMVENFTIFLAYNADIDAIVRVSELKKIFTKKDFLKLKDEPLPTTIESKEDLLIGIINSMKNGTGEELPMNGRISCWLRKRIKPREKRMGGQIGIMSNVLSNLGFNCLVYFPLLSKEQSKLFERNPNLKFLTKDGWKPSGIYFKNVPTKINWIFEFSKGEKLFDVVAKDSSRFIAASRPDEDRIKSPLLESKVDEINEKADKFINIHTQDINVRCYVIYYGSSYPYIRYVGKFKLCRYLQFFKKPFTCLYFLKVGAV